MYKTDKISPTDLHLDEKNPRFRISVNPSQEEIRAYMLMHEDVLKLATKMTEMDTVLPGERIIIFKDGDRNIVLEGNRRTCAFQLFLDRNLIPQQYLRSFPKASESFLKEISEIDVDVVKTREEAMAFLAARHIVGVKTWSSVSKWRISYEYYQNGMEINEIASTLILPVSSIRKFIYDYKILLRGLREDNWNEEEQRILNPLDIKPDKLIRLFHLADTTRELGLFFSDDFTLKSSYISDEGIDNVICVLTKKAFIDNTINTRTKYSEIEEDIKAVANSYKMKNMGADPEKQQGISQDEAGNDTQDMALQGGKGGNALSDAFKSDKASKEASVKEADNTVVVGGKETSVQSGIKDVSADKRDIKDGKTEEKGASDITIGAGVANATPGAQNATGSGGKRNLPYFFQGINYSHLQPNDPDTHGISRVCLEIQQFSDKQLVKSYPLSAAFLVRSVIEHSIIYYSKKHYIQGQSKLIWLDISRNNHAVKLSEIIKKYKTNLPNYISESNIKQYFMSLFGNYEDNVDPLNWVIHRPDEYQLDPETLIQLPRKGLLSLVNYLIIG